MAATDGTALVRFKVAFMALLDNYVSGAIYNSPQKPEDMLAQGTGQAAWWADEVDAEIGVTVQKGAPHWFDEVSHPVLRIQAVGLNTGDTQAIVDARASQMLYYAVGILADNPTVGLTSDDIDTFYALPETYKYSGGLLGESNRAARFELTIRLEARLKLDI